MPKAYPSAGDPAGKSITAKTAGLVLRPRADLDTVELKARAAGCTTLSSCLARSSGAPARQTL
jgi:hypothetical protein